MHDDIDEVTVRGSYVEVGITHRVIWAFPIGSDKHSYDKEKMYMCMCLALI